MKPCDHDSRPLYEKLIDPLREKARELGYALGVHGTLKRDIDLIACPWVTEAVDARTLAEALLAVAAEHNGGTAYLKPHEDNGYFWSGCAGHKPHGRLVWTFQLGGGPYIDLSVMPRAERPAVRWVGQEDAWGCGVAALAMITGKSYREVAADWAHSFARSGMDYMRADQWLTLRGYATARKWRHDHDWKERPDWPPAPFGDVHLCDVVVSETSPGGHFVVLLADGRVLDPLTPEPRRLADYWKVNNVAAVVKRDHWYDTGEEIVRAREEAERRGPILGYVQGIRTSATT